MPLSNLGIPVCTLPTARAIRKYEQLELRGRCLSHQMVAVDDVRSALGLGLSAKPAADSKQSTAVAKTS